MYLQPRDRDIIDWLSRYGSATYDQLACAFDTTVGALRQRLPRLAQRGYVQRIEARRGILHLAVWVATPGAEILTRRRILPRPPESIDVARAWRILEVGLEARSRGNRVLARAELLKAAERAALERSMATGRRIQVDAEDHPDLVIRNAAGGTTAVEFHDCRPEVGYWQDRLINYVKWGSPRILLVTDDIRVVADAFVAARGLGYQGTVGARPLPSGAPERASRKF